jgi:hypothetical protein
MIDKTKIGAGAEARSYHRIRRVIASLGLKDDMAIRAEFERFESDIRREYETDTWR